MYLNDGGNNWLNSNGWLGSSNHCSWAGITCSSLNRVTQVNLQGNQLSGPMPTDLSTLGSLETLYVSGNSLIGMFPNDICNQSTSNYLYINGDAVNCSNDYNELLGEYRRGCCDVVVG